MQARTTEAVAEPAPGPRNMFMVVTKRLRIEGFIVSDHFDRFGEFAREAGEWLRDGRLCKLSGPVLWCVPRSSQTTL